MLGNKADKSIAWTQITVPREEIKGFRSLMRGPAAGNPGVP
jgi:hypothetical protein